jgi:hypothetical protein
MIVIVFVQSNGGRGRGPWEKARRRQHIALRAAPGPARERSHDSFIHSFDLLLILYNTCALVENCRGERAGLTVNGHSTHDVPRRLGTSEVPPCIASVHVIEHAICDLKKTALALRPSLINQ